MMRSLGTAAIVVVVLGVGACAPLEQSDVPDNMLEPAGARPEVALGPCTNPIDCGSIPTPRRAGKGGSSMDRMEYLDVGDYLTSRNRLFYLILQDDGNVCIRRGSSPADDLGVLWCVGQLGNISVTHGRDGNFCAIRAQGASWCTNSVGPGPSTVVLQDDGNLVVMYGRRVAWQLGRAWPNPSWLPGGKQMYPDIGGDYYGTAWWGGDKYLVDNYPQFTPPYRVWMGVPKSPASDATPQRFLFLPDGTVHLANDASLCLQVGVRWQTQYFAYRFRYLEFAKCGAGKADQVGWQYSPSTRQITHSKYPKACLHTNVYEYRFSVVLGDDCSPGVYVESGGGKDTPGQQEATRQWTLR